MIVKERKTVSVARNNTNRFVLGNYSPYEGLDGGSGILFSLKR